MYKLVNCYLFERLKVLLKIFKVKLYNCAWLYISFLWLALHCIHVKVYTMSVALHLSDNWFHFCFANVASNFSGTGALAIFLRKSYNLDITTSDYDDNEIEKNIAHNCQANEIPIIPHIKRETSLSWLLVICFLAVVKGFRVVILITL